MHFQMVKFGQRGITFYFLPADPRIIIKYCKFADSNKLQENQRPWDPKRVKEIAKYVSGRVNLKETDLEIETTGQFALGLIPNCPLLNLTKKLIVDSTEECYIDIPDDPERIFEILDGQHRLIAFDDSYIELEDSVQYEMGFVVCDRLTSRQKKELFMVPNKTQKNVDSNVLLAMMEELDLLNSKNDRYYKVIIMLGTESLSPLFGRIKLGGEQIKGGLSPDALMKIFDKSKFLDRLSSKGDPTEQFNRLIPYLEAWDDVYPEKRVKTHTLNKIQGIRYIMILGPSIIDIITSKNKKWTKDDIADVLKVMRSEIIDPESLFNREKGTINPFSSQSATESLAETHGNRLKAIYKEALDDIFDT